MKKISILIIVSVLISSIFTNAYSQLVNNTQKELVSSEIAKPINLSAIEFKAMIEKGDVILLDVRTINEFKQGHLKGAINIDWYKRTFETKVAELDKEKTILIYCRSGNRTGKTKYFMIGMGFTKVYNLEYGINDWARNKFEFVR